MIERIWKDLKRWRTLRVGPLAFLFRVQRSVRVTGTSRRQLRAASHRHREWVGRRLVQSCGPVQVTSPVRGKEPEIALIVGVGPGFGHALAWRLAKDGMAVIVASRDAKRLGSLAAAITSSGAMAFAYGCDATNEASVLELFQNVESHHGIPTLVVYSLQNSEARDVVDVELCAFEDGWRHNCLGAFLVARQAARSMVPVGRGSIVLTGSTSSLIGRAGHLTLAVGKFGQRAISQVLARELWPKGIHVAHMIIDADIHEDRPRDDGGPQSDPADIAELVLSVHRQPRSAWTSEIDVRPWNERFWEHC
jgi:NAD(P)-dependent dehydrogenase (short-subunit alcohol dehydrogenase family)